MAEPKGQTCPHCLGEALAGERGVGIDLPTVQAMAKEIAEEGFRYLNCSSYRCSNLWRGEPAAEAGMDRVQVRTILVCLEQL